MESNTNHRAEVGFSLHHAIGHLLAEAPSFGDVAERIVEEICRGLEWDLGAVWLLDHANGVLRCVGTWARPDPRLDEFRQITARGPIPMGASLPGRAWATRQPTWILDLSDDDNFFRAGLGADLGLRSGFAVPIAAGNGPLGAMEFFGRRNAPPDGSLVQIMEGVALQIGQFVDRERAEEEATRDRARAAALFDSALDCVITFDGSGRIADFNAAAEQTFGYWRADVVGRLMAEVIVPPALLEQHLVALRSRLPMVADRPWRIETVAMRADGSEFPAEVNVARVSAPGPPLYAAHLRDLTERRRTDERMTFLASRDAVTGLPNRETFDQALRESLTRADRLDLAVALLSIDLDEFWSLNVGLGQAAGNDVLREAGSRLREVVGRTDRVTRSGSDEFMVLLADLPRQGQLKAGRTNGATTIAETVACRVHQALAKPVVAAGTEVVVTGSIGVSVYPVDAPDGATLLRNAQAAMRRSRAIGPGGYLVHAPATHQPAGETLGPAPSLGARLRRAVAERQWLLHYQPLVELESRRVIAVEALLRWDDPDLGLQGPSSFIPLAEELGLIEPIGEWVLDELVSKLRGWDQNGHRFAMSFNVSPGQLDDPEFVTRLLDRLSRAGLDPSRLVAEVTETAAMVDPERTGERLKALREGGVRLAIDDFGTGHSSLSRLRDLPADILKIDGSFVRDCPERRDACEMVAAIVDLAHRLGIAALAEGIETEDQRQFLIEQGCLLGQGFRFAPPVPDDRLGDLVLELGGPEPNPAHRAG